MDKETLKSLIIEKRNKNYTFEKIAQELNSEYAGLNMNRQKVHGLYKRAKKKEEEKDENYPVTLALVNLRARGYKVTEVTSIALSMGYDVNYQKVRNILENEEMSIDHVKKDLRVSTAKYISEGEDIENIKQKLKYKNVAPTEEETTEILVDAYAIIVKHVALNELARVYHELKDKSLINKIISKTGLQITLDEIRKRADIIFYDS